MPIISFIVPFRAPETTKHWESVSRYLTYTVENLLNQTFPDIEVHVVGHVPPAHGLVKDRRLYFHAVDEPVPDQLTSVLMNRDRRRKIVHGCMAAASRQPRYIMPVDADDRVHPRLAEFLAEQPEHPAWVIRDGHVVHAQLRRFYKTSRYQDLTGSSCILSLQETGIPCDISFGEFNKCYWFLGHHKVFVAEMRKRGIQPEEITFSAGAYILGHGANLSNRLRIQPIQRIRFYMRYFLFGRKLDETFYTTYGQV